MRKLTKAKIAECDKQTVAHHEAGHALLFEHYGHECLALLIPDSEGDPENVKYWAGTVRHDPIKSNFQAAVIGWAGITSEIADFKNGYNTTEIEIMESVENELVVPSRTDWKYIRRHPNRLRTLTAALRIIGSKQARLNQIIKRLCSKGCFRRDSKRARVRREGNRYRCAKK